MWSSKELHCDHFLEVFNILDSGTKSWVQSLAFIFSPSTFSPLLSSDCARTLTCSLAHCLSSCLFSYFFNNYLLKAKWTLLNNPWDKVKEIIQQYLLSIIEFSIIAYSGDFEFNCKFFVFVDCSVTIDHLAQGDYSKIWHNPQPIRVNTSL